MEYTDFEKKMMALTPVMPELDQASVAFAAGYRKGRRTARVWQLSSGGMALLLVMLSVYVLLVTGRTSTPVADLGYTQFASVDNTQVHRPGIMINASLDRQPVRKLNENSYLNLRNKVLEHGVDALPKSSGRKSEVMTLQEALQG